MQTTLSAHLTFREAADLWLDSRTFRTGNRRARYIAPATLKSYATYLRVLNKFLGSIILADIHIGHLAQYQQERCERTGPNKVNQELSVVSQILKRANLWTAELADAYEPLQRVEGDVPRSLSPEEQQLWLDVASSQERWRVVHLYSIIAFRTTASNIEMRGLRLADVNLFSGAITIQSAHAKNKYRMRTIALAPDALEAIHVMVSRAHSLGSSAGHHYLFPYRFCHGMWDPCRPMSNSGIKKPWNEIRKETGLVHFRIHDTRHTAITRYAESGTPIPVVMSMAGHISPRMMQHYTQISEQAQRRAVDAVYHGRPYSVPKKQPSAEPRLSTGQWKNNSK